MKLAWQEEDFLHLMKQLEFRPGHINSHALYTIWLEKDWGVDDFDYARDAFVKKDFLYIDSEGEMFLTERGFKAMKEGVWLLEDEEHTVTLGELKDAGLEDLMALPDDTKVIFGSGNLSFSSIKKHKDGLFQIEFNE